MQRLLSLAALLAFACAASAQTTLDVTVPGNTVCSYATGPVTTGSTPGHLQATATGMSGSGCGSTSGGSGGVTFGPASPLSPSTTTTLNNTGGTANFSFQTVNATACTGTITPSTGTSFTTPFCNSAVACNGSQSVTASFPANPSTQNDASYTVSVACTGPGSATPVASPVSPKVIVSHTSVVQSSCPTINSGTTGIANFTQWTGNQQVVYYGNGPTGGVHSVNVTSFTSFYQANAWPGQQIGLIGQPTLPNGKYVSLVFQVPNGYLAGKPDTILGQYSVGSSGYSAPVSMTISTTCGDFSNPTTNPTTSTVVPGCYKNKSLSPGGIVWRKTGSCALQDGKTYYLNFINADISNLLPNGQGTAISTRNSQCPAGSCSDPIDNGPGNWQ